MMKNITTQVELITPDVARNFLSFNKQNRPINKAKVREISTEMQEGRWLFDGAPIRFDKNGVLLDGQHRLNAILVSGKEFDILVVRGLEPETFKVMDTGKMRGGSDIFNIEGVPNASTASASCSFILSYKANKEGKGIKAYKVSNSRTLELYREYPSFDEYVRSGMKLYHLSHKLLPSSWIIGYEFLMSEINVAKATKFWNEVCTGIGLTEGSPTLQLRDALLADKAKSYIHSKMSKHMKQALIVKAWNLYLTDRTVKKLYFQVDRDATPKIG